MGPSWGALRKFQGMKMWNLSGAEPRVHQPPMDSKCLCFAGGFLGHLILHSDFSWDNTIPNNTIPACPFHHELFQISHFYVLDVEGSQVLSSGNISTVTLRIRHLLFGWQLLPSLMIILCNLGNATWIFGITYSEVQFNISDGWITVPAGWILTSFAFSMENMEKPSQTSLLTPRMGVMAFLLWNA